MKALEEVVGAISEGVKFDVEAPRQWRCDTHGPAKAGAWGCPECVHEMRAEIEELDALRETLADILRRTAVALRGPEPPLTMWSWHDLPERSAAAIALAQAAKASLTAAQPAPHLGQVLAFENPITRDDVAEADIARLRADRDVLLNALTHISEDGWDDSESWQDLWARTKKTARDALAKAHSIREAKR